MRAHSHRHRFQSRCDNVRNNFALWKNNRQWPGPEFFHQLTSESRFNGRDLVQRLPIWQMHNEWVEAWTLFCLENFSDRIWIERIGRQSVNRFSRERDYFTVAQQFDRLRAFLRGNDFRFHFGSFAASTASVCFLRNASRF